MKRSMRATLGKVQKVTEEENDAIINKRERERKEMMRNINEVWATERETKTK